MCSRLFKLSLCVFSVAGILVSACVDESFQAGPDGVPPALDGGTTPAVDFVTGAPRPSCPGRESSITGTVYAPNGVDPVAGATVFVPSQVPELFTPEVRCEACGSLGTAYNLWTTTSDAKGRFALDNVCPGPRSLVLQNGRFRRFLTVAVPEKGELALTAQQSRLPRRTAEFSPIDAIPRIAVVTGDFDKMECVLAKMGVGVFDLYEGARVLVSPKKLRPFTQLLGDLAAMKRYNIIFINCTDNTFEDQLKNKAIRDNISEYVRAGGRLYVTDWSYDWIEQVEELSPFIDFEPGPSSPAPEPRNAAALGKGGLSVQASIVDPDLAAWLENFPGAVQGAAQPSAKIDHFLAGWVMVHHVGKETKLWVQGKVSPANGAAKDSKIRPLTLTFNFKNCGKILFSSYHTEGRDNESPIFPQSFPSYCGSAASPQDRILQYLIFDIASCVKPIL